MEFEEPALPRTSYMSVTDDGGHALIASARALGSATAVLPVVSTLSFGFAAGTLSLALHTRGRRAASHRD